MLYLRTNCVEKTGDLSRVASALGHNGLKSTIRYITSLLEDTSETHKEKSSANVFPKAASAPRRSLALVALRY
jgi:hypothetical protein